MNASELRQMSDEELRKKELDLREDLFKLQFQHKIRSLENPARLRQIRKDIARVHTVLTEQAQA
ncbi:MAG: 50S ribosomal protein L29 [Candidatus Electrothrix sp. AR5]|jgi:large subunit ribosomal protein L29|nr:50S ribosomal protein L29 [Candidatus Electrothrix sp. AR5]